MLNKNVYFFKRFYSAVVTLTLNQKSECTRIFVVSGPTRVLKFLIIFTYNQILLLNHYKKYLKNMTQKNSSDSFIECDSFLCNLKLCKL